MSEVMDAERRKNIEIGAAGTESHRKSPDQNREFPLGRRRPAGATRQRNQRQHTEGERRRDDAQDHLHRKRSIEDRRSQCEGRNGQQRENQDRGDVDLLEKGMEPATPVSLQRSAPGLACFPVRQPALRVIQRAHPLLERSLILARLDLAEFGDPPDRQSGDQTKQDREAAQPGLRCSDSRWRQ
jgi:hypothetical protein